MNLIINNFLRELQQEALVTRNYLAAVPFAQAAFQPHEKSETLGRLAIHVAEILGWWKSTLAYNELDFKGYQPKDIRDTEALLSYFDELLAEAIQALSNAQDSDLAQEWSMRNGEMVYFTLPKQQILRTFCLNHWVHHRAQLGVYLRLLGVPVPATYGPSADDFNVLLVERI